MAPDYDPYLLALAFFLAVVSAWMALSLAQRVLEASGRTGVLWVIGAAAAMGVGLWSIMFIGLLALRLPIQVTYSPAMTASTLLCSMGLSVIAVKVAVTRHLSARRLLIGALLVGIGFVTMRRIGVSAMLISPRPETDLSWLGVAALVTTSTVVTCILVVNRMAIRRLMPPMRHQALAALGMGSAIWIAQMVGLFSMRVPAEAVSLAPSDAIDHVWMAIWVTTGSVSVMTMALIATLFDAHMSSQTWQLNQSLSQVNQELAFRALHDVLTGLPNRSLLADRVDRAIEDATRDGEIMALLFIDLDRFKAVNDTLGHHNGDELLRQVAQRLGSRIHPTDTLARLGGDEFVALRRNLHHPSEAAEFATALHEGLSAQFVIEDRVIHVSSTVGIALFPNDARNAEDLLICADSAMHHGKQAGRSNFHFFAQGMNEIAQRRFDIESGLRRAISQGELELYYQPKVHINSESVVSVEALVRWNHPQGGVVAPDQFIPIAEESGLIAPLGAWVLRAACQQNVVWQRAGLRAMRIAVNISARQFHESDLFHLVTTTLADTGMGAEFLELELTESTIMQDADKSISILTALNDLGVHIAIDDFGTGYSSLAYLKKLPLQKLKVDRAFIRELDSNPDDEAIVKAVISMAHSLRLEVVAEGVETADQLARLKSLSCDEFQGYFFSPPVRAAELTAILESELSPAVAIKTRAAVQPIPPASAAGPLPTAPVSPASSAFPATVIAPTMSPTLPSPLRPAANRSAAPERQVKRAKTETETDPV